VQGRGRERGSREEVEVQGRGRERGSREEVEGRGKERGSREEVEVVEVLRVKGEWMFGLAENLEQ